MSQQPNPKHRSHACRPGNARSNGQSHQENSRRHTNRRRKAMKGPLDRLMSDLGIESSAYGVAQLYKGVAQGFVIDNVDKQLVPKIKDLDMKVVPTQTIMDSAAAKAKLAQDTMRLAENL